ncbi:MAG: sulfatase-like hydrolase/transferase [Lacibacter sp.]|nr:sulfatase-like hydrolase/transferase [Lacibacter sp.]
MQKPNKSSLLKFPFHLFLVPLFFILNKYVQYHGLTEVKTAILFAFQITLFVLISLFMLRFIQGNWLKASLSTSVLTLLFLFFGDIRFFLQKSTLLQPLSHYKLLFPILLLILFLFFKSIKKEAMLLRTTYFFNFLLLVYTVFETVRILQLNHISKKENSPLAFNLPDSVKKNLPDIYFLVPDCYPSTSYQKEVLDINNQPFDDTLTKLGFRVLQESKSNYNRTAFSMLSTFDMSYTNIVDTFHATGSREYQLAMKQILTADLFMHLKNADYNFINLSIFDFANTKALRKQNFLNTTSKGMFLSHTFWNYFSRDIFFTWFSKKKKNGQNEKKEMYEPLKEYNQQIIDTLVQTDFSTSNQPVFLYAHLNMPHYPYFYDANGTPYAEDSIYNKEMISNKTRFAGYIQYSNKQLLRIINSIKNKTNGKAIIVLQSDHGLSNITSNKKSNAFRNYSAFYFPDADYSKLYDSMSNVNSFRIILNKYMNQSLPLLHDESFYVFFR